MKILAKSGFYVKLIAWFNFIRFDQSILNENWS